MDQRRWGYYVCPVLFRDVFLGRLEGDVKSGVFTVRKVWLERALSVAEEAALRAALQRHAEGCDATLALEASLSHDAQPNVATIAGAAKRGLSRSKSAEEATPKAKKRAQKKVP